MEAQLTQTATALTLTRVFAAPAARVYQAWTDPTQMNAWLHPNPAMTSRCTVDLQVGGRYEIQMLHPKGDRHVVGGRYEEIVPGEKLVFTWRWQGDPTDETTRVTILFRALGEAETELTLIHERFPDEESRDSHAAGWQGTFDRLAEHLA